DGIRDFHVTGVQTCALPISRAGARVGTPAYSAPETVRDAEHSAKSDQFSMAACLYEGLSGKRAFPGAEAVKVATAIEKNTPLPRSEERRVGKEGRARWQERQ